MLSSIAHYCNKRVKNHVCCNSGQYGNKFGFDNAKYNKLIWPNFNYLVINYDQWYGPASNGTLTRPGGLLNAYQVPYSKYIRNRNTLICYLSFNTIKILHDFSNDILIDTFHIFIQLKIQKITRYFAEKNGFKVISI